jgi:hypothetical protein
MKTRVIDKELVLANRKDVDPVWEVFANYLIRAFGDITTQSGVVSDEEGEMVYCHHRLRELDEHMLDSLVYNVPPAVAQSPVDGHTDDAAVEFMDRRASWRSSPESPFLLLGYVGTGKTTFLDHYFNRHLRKRDPSVHGIIVDFKTAPDDDTDFVKYLLLQVDRQLADICPQFAGNTRELLGVLYDKEVTEIRATITNVELQSLEIDRIFALVLRAIHEVDSFKFAEFIERKIRHLTDSGKKLWIVLDNIDQHYHALHNRAFLQSVSIAHRWKCPLIIAMRYVTLVTPSARQAYDSYRPRRLKLSLPHPGKMIERRIEYFKLLADDIMERTTPWTNHVLRVSDLASDIHQCAALLTSHEFLTRHLLPLSNYNMRRLLEIVLSAFQSYYFFYDRFNNDRYLPKEPNVLKRFIYAHLLKNNEYYDPSHRNSEDQFILNMFDNENSSVPYNHTVRIRLLQCLIRFGRHISLARFYQYVQGMFSYDRLDILSALRSLISKELVSIKNIMQPNFDTSIFFQGLTEAHLASDDIEVSISYCGRLHYELIGTLEYVEIMKFSTYIDESQFDDIQSQKAQSTIDKRSKGTRLFTEYLIKQEDLEVKGYVRSQVRFEGELGKVMPKVHQLVSQQLLRVGELPPHRQL